MDVISNLMLKQLSFFFFYIHRLSTPVGTPNPSKQVEMQPTYLNNWLWSFPLTSPVVKSPSLVMKNDFLQ